MRRALGKGLGIRLERKRTGRAWEWRRSVFSQVLVCYRSFNEIGRDGDIKCLWQCP